MGTLATGLFESPVQYWADCSGSFLVPAAHAMDYFMASTVTLCGPWWLAAPFEVQVAIIACALISSLACGGIILCASAMLSNAVRGSHSRAGPRGRYPCRALS